MRLGRHFKRIVTDNIDPCWFLLRLISERYHDVVAELPCTGQGLSGYDTVKGVALRAPFGIQDIQGVAAILIAPALCRTSILP